MEAAAVPGAVLSDEELAELLALMCDADRVELKLTIPLRDRSATIAALDLDPMDAQIRQVFFFDTPDLALSRAGLLARARRTQDRGDDTIVKLGPVGPVDLPETLPGAPGVTLEVDAMADGFVCSAMVKERLDSAHVRDTVAGKRPVRKLFSRRQRDFIAVHAPGEVEIEDLTAMGPIFVLRLRFTPAPGARRMTAELWLYPDGSRVLELSRKCSPDRAFEAAAETRSLLAGRGVDLGDLPDARTRSALEFFARQMPANAQALRA